MAKFTILTVKKALALAYPDIEFTYGTAGRGRLRGPSVSWDGGPDAESVRKASGYVWERREWYFVRRLTEAELSELHRKWEEDARIRAAAEPARRAAAKAAGIEKRKATIAFNKARAATLETAFPDTRFVTEGSDVAWTDGPEVEEVTSLLSIQKWQCTRYESQAAKADKALRAAVKTQANRLARRLAQSKVRAIRVAKGIERRLYAGLGNHRGTVDLILRDTRQMPLPMDFPYWAKPPVYFSREF